MPKGIYKREPHSKETKQKMSLSRLKRKEKLGYINSPETREKLSNNLKQLYKEGNLILPTMLGKHHSNKTKRKMKAIRQGKSYEEIFGEEKGKRLKERFTNEKNPAWKGDKAKTISYHAWLSRHKPKSKVCEFCGKTKDKFGHTKLVLANINNHQYTRNPKHYKWGHYSCHNRYDSLNRKKK